MRDRHTLCRADDSARPPSSHTSGPPPSTRGRAQRSTPAVPYRYGYRPGIAGRRLHCVLPGGWLDHHRERPISWGWCGAAAYLDNGEDADWGHWLTCRECAPGYQRHLVLRLLAATAQPNVTEHALVQQLPSVPVHELLADLRHEGVVDLGHTPNGRPLYRLRATSATALAYRDALR
jgi:hypothetical protein